MMEFIKLARRRGLWADVTHTALNLLYAVLLVAVIIAFPNTPWPALVLVLLSKWRVIAVRPRYWWANFLGSLPDVVLALGVTILMWHAGDVALATGLTAWPVQVSLGLFYAVWLIWLKPQHKSSMVLLQSGLSQFVGIMAIFSVAYALPLVVVVLLAFVVAFASSRQQLGIHEEKEHVVLALIWSLVVAQLAFAAWHWTVAYQITPLLKVPQIAIIITVLGFVTERFYYSYKKNDAVKWSDVGWPIVFAIIVILLLIFGFGGLFV